MKKLFTLLLLSLPVMMVAQTFPLVKEGAIWRESMGYQAPPNSGFHKTQFLMEGDTTIAAVSYTKVYETNYDSVITTKTYIGAIREDSLSRIYFLMDSTFGQSPYFYTYPGYIDTAEILLYDFNLTAQDTFFSSSAYMDSTILVQAVDSILVNGSYRKRLRVLAGNMYGNISWIEGIGSTKGLFSTTYGEFECAFRLCCYEDDQVFWTNPDLYSDCFKVGTQEYTAKVKDMEIFPNPASSRLFINSELVHIEIVEIYSATGSLILQKKADSKHLSIDVSSLKPGLYLLRIKTNNTVSTRKILVSGK